MRLSSITNEIAPASFGVSHAMDRPIWNYSITHGPAPTERDLMNAWIRDLRVFVNDEEGYLYGTELTTDYKVMQPQGTIAIERDGRWEELLQSRYAKLKPEFKVMGQSEDNITPPWGSLPIEQYLLKLRRIAEKYLPDNDLYGKLVVLRTYSGEDSDSIKFRRWIYDAAAAFEQYNPLGDLFGDTDDYCDLGWESIYHRLPELASPELRRTFSDQDVSEVKEEVSAVITSREPGEDDYEDAISHVAVSGCWLLVLDRESFGDEEMLLVFQDKKGNVVWQSSIKTDELGHISHYIMRGSIIESGFWRDAEIGKKYKNKGKIMHEILPMVMAEAE
ncbi:hypothetical protein FGADI_5607 [Fusarium gaditjirri]|uniref:Uncharacterized protein n=1 Tax=Fusarium gaditjirri TaxID=282569 RepID=A0A8H4WX10_9HYPO|nr:hypothetical protein FGADI_5607 [Fusarium gaditjirri]